MGIAREPNPQDGLDADQSLTTVLQNTAPSKQDWAEIQVPDNNNTRVENTILNYNSRK